jgi:peptidoglycan/LPS O-acetylase OafA/YrhL
VNDQTSSIPSIGDPQSGGVRMLGKIDALDGFRGCAVLLIVVHHLPVAVPWLFHRVTKGGGFGVDAFFVLSGFLITAILLRDQARGGRVRFGAFYRRRAMRLLPALVLFLAVYMCYEWVTSMPGAHEPSTALSILFYYSNTWLHRVPTSPGLGNMWSLAVEEQFYLVWPLCLSLFFGLRRRLAPTVVILVGTIGVVAIRRAIMWNHGVSWLWLYTRLFTRADALLVGCLLALLWVHGKLPKRGVQLAGWLALSYFLYLVRHGAGDPFMYRGGYTLLALAVGTMLLAILQTDWLVNRVLRAAPLRAVGRVSYGLYIWHLAVFNAVLRYGRNWPPITQATVALSVAALVTYGSWVLVERPFLRWKDRLEVAGRDRGKPPSGAPPNARPKVKSSRSSSFRHVAIPVPD